MKAFWKTEVIAVVVLSPTHLMMHFCLHVLTGHGLQHLAPSVLAVRNKLAV